VFLQRARWNLHLKPCDEISATPILFVFRSAILPTNRHTVSGASKELVSVLLLKVSLEKGLLEPWHTFLEG
jgi:hypothetical protein